MADSISFTVLGKPATQGSKRHVGHGILVESCKGLKDWRAYVRIAAAQAKGGDAIWRVPVRIFARFHMPRPKAHYRTGKHAGILRDDAPVWVSSGRRGDGDKLMRALFDAMTGVIYCDDEQVANHVCEKLWSNTGQYSCEITVSRLDDRRPATVASVRAFEESLPQMEIMTGEGELKGKHD